LQTLSTVPFRRAFFHDVRTLNICVAFLQKGMIKGENMVWLYCRMPDLGA